MSVKNITNGLLPKIEFKTSKEKKPATVQQLRDAIIARHELIKPEEKEILFQQYQFFFEGNKMMMEGRGDEVYRIHPAAEYAIYETIKTKAGFREFAPEMFPKAINEAVVKCPWFQKARFARIAHSDSGEKIIRAFVSDKYGYLDDKDWIVPALDNLNENWEVETANILDEYSHVRVVHKTTEALAVGDNVKKALDFKNSEIAQGGLRIQFLYFILRCTNGMMSPKLKDFLSTMHRGGDKIENFQNNLLQLMGNAEAGGWDEIKNIFNIASDIKIGDLSKANKMIEKAAKPLALKKAFIEPIQEEYAGNPLDESLYALSQAFSKVAQQYERDDRYVLEKAGGRILDYDVAKYLLPKSEAQLLRV